jgi:hypothetical protein
MASLGTIRVTGAITRLGGIRAVMVAAGATIPRDEKVAAKVHPNRPGHPGVMIGAVMLARESRKAGLRLDVTTNNHR